MKCVCKVALMGHNHHRSHCRNHRQRRRQIRVVTCDSAGYRARWLDYHAGVTKELTVGTDPFEELRDKFDSEEKARTAATAKLNTESAVPTRANVAKNAVPDLARRSPHGG